MLACAGAWATLQQESLIHLEDFYFFTACTGHEIIISSGPHPTPSCWKLLCPACKFAFEHIHLCKACGPLRGLTFQGPKTRSVSLGGRVASEVCETCGSAWATLQQESLIHLEGFYFPTACTGHELITSSGPHPTPPVGNCFVQHANSRLNTITCARPVAR